MDAYLPKHFNETLPRFNVTPSATSHTRDARLPVPSATSSASTLGLSLGNKIYRVFVNKHRTRPSLRTHKLAPGLATTAPGASYDTPNSKLAPRKNFHRVFGDVQLGPGHTASSQLQSQEACKK
ncbi:hypothetical protein D9611_012325 [Ephemerocybe angulata]|uniref:Uncharacterized protein n=1 Tax=Ephemerocybe angulata TaxID=980116 RepID=A0A8H5ATA9_9AGAR|nr:hypothetical protein D9611_012325 [Tulosesus angulatus]